MKISFKDVGFAAFFLLVIALVAVEAAETGAGANGRQQQVDLR